MRAKDAESAADQCGLVGRKGGKKNAEKPETEDERPCFAIVVNDRLKMDLPTDVFHPSEVFATQVVGDVFAERKDIVASPIEDEAACRVVE